jgi:hypothetical protein
MKVEFDEEGKQKLEAIISIYELLLQSAEKFPDIKLTEIIRTTVIDSMKEELEWMWELHDKMRFAQNNKI